MKRIVFAFVLLITSLSFASLTDGLVGYWPFDGDAKDYSGNSNHGSIYGVTSTNDRHGNIGQAFYFSGGDHISVSANAQLNAIRDFSASFWVNVTDYDITSSGHKAIALLSKGGSSRRQFGVTLGVDTNNVPFFQLVLGDRIHCREISKGAWTHVAVTREGKYAILYMNGSRVSSGTICSDPAGDSGDLDFGIDVPGGVEYLHGAMDDVCLYNRALSSAEVSAIYNGGLKIRKVVFNANAVEVEGAMPSLSVLSGTQEKLPKNAFRRHDGYVFQGWAKSKSDADNGIVKYQDEEEITIESDMTLYAVWASPSMTLAAESADWSSGSITLRCTDVDTSGRTHTYTLQYYDESTDTWKDVSSVQSASASVSLPDTDFSSRLGGIPPVKYRVKDENGRVSAECVTRNRFLLSIGYTAYFDWTCPKVPQTYEDAKAFASLCNKLGDFKSFTGRNVETTELRTKIEEMSTLACPGDVFVFYISTHGHDSGLWSGAGITTYNGNYSAEDLQEDVRKFSSGVAVVNVIVACHSAAMIGSDDKRFWLKKKISDYRFNQCLGNIAWITSCDLSQNTPVWSDFTQFGAFFIGHGFQEGYADLQLHGTDYKGGNGDGRLTLGELGRYVRELSIGISDEAPAEVQLENEGLLDRIVMAEGIVCKPLNPPPPPSNVRASKGDFDHKIRVSWTTSSAAKYYRLYRCPVNETSSPAFDWIDFVPNKVGDGPGSLDDKDVFERRILPFAMYGYRVQAMNQVGYGELSEITTDSFGWRGSLDFKNFLLNALISFTESSIDAASVTASEYNVIESTVAANGCRTVGECYALGINPEDPDDDFRIKSFKMDGTKPVVTVNHTEDGSGASLLPRMKMLGKAELSGEWEEVPEEGNPAHRFFTVTVEEP